MAKPGFRLALFATLLALIVVLLGAYTRLTHAGLGCPDWPGCYGFISVPKSEAQLAHAELHFPDTPVEAAQGLERDDPPLLRRHVGAVDLGAGRSRLGASPPSGATGEACRCFCWRWCLPRRRLACGR